MNRTSRHTVLLIQLPIPPLGPAPIRGNVPLAAAYMKLFADRKGLGSFYDIDILPAAQANRLGDRALVAAIVDRRPWLVGFTCYLWNIERVLWVAAEVRRRLPDVRIVLGGPEITADNAWVLRTLDYDYAVIGEGEQTFAQLLLALLDDDRPPLPIAGLHVPADGPGPRYEPARQPERRSPLPDLNVLCSPYLAGVLDAADEEMLLLETARGCRYRCRFCYYWKSYDGVYQLSDDNIRACLRHAAERGVREVFLLDPTLNQRKDFAHLLRLLAEGNPGRRFSYFGELRGEGVTEETARLLRAANFTEVEVGLQSVDPDAMNLMDRKNNLRAFERGVRAMLAEGIKVRVDLIVGLPGDTVESVRRGLSYLHDGGLYSDLQVFNLAVLPGTAFRADAAALGLTYQPRPPYYALRTPTLRREDFFELMHEAQLAAGVEFDAPPRPVLDAGGDGLWTVDLDGERTPPPPADRRRQAFTLWLRAAELGKRRTEAAAALVRGVLRDNPFTTLQVVLEPTDADEESVRRQVTASLLRELMAVCQEAPTYLDRFYALQPGSLNGAKRLIVLLPQRLRDRLGPEWLDDVGTFATLVWRGAAADAEEEMAEYEYALPVS